MLQVEEDSNFARVEALSEIAKEFAASDAKPALIEKAKGVIAGEELSEEDKSNGAIYVKLMEKTVEKVCTLGWLPRI